MADADRIARALHLVTPGAPAPAPEPDPALGERVRPMIVVRERLNEVAAEAEAALLADPGAGLYVRSRNLARVVRDSGDPRGGVKRSRGLPVIEALTLDALGARLDHAARWVRYDRRSHAEREARPPEWVARSILALDEWRFPVLAGVVEAPTLTPGGEVISCAGYNEASGLLLMPSGDFPPIPPGPTAGEIKAAANLMREPFCDFPFVADYDLAAAVAAILTLVARHAIEGPAPLFAFRATAPGTGKSLACDVVCIIGTGRKAARMAFPAEDEEVRKVVLSAAFEATPCILLDNMDRALGSHALAAALTASEWQGRMLGTNLILRAPLRAVWLATGNGLTFKGDLGRRVVPVDMDARLEHPEDRTAFRHAGLLGWVQEHRGDLLAAGLTILRAYHVAGRPAHRCGPRIGSFEAWDDLVRGACVWAGIGDPLAGRERIRAEDDGDLLALRAALAAWREEFGNGPRATAEAVSHAESLAARSDPALRDSTLRDALLALTNRDKLAARDLGYALRRVKGRICDGLHFETAGDEHAGSRRWVVRGSREVMKDMEDIFPPHARANMQSEGEWPESSPPSPPSPPAVPDGGQS